MIYGLWQSAGGLQAQDYRQTILANNLANADTPGFKPDNVAFAERLNASLARGKFSGANQAFNAITGGVFETPIHTDYQQGPLLPSDNRFDVAIHGDGFLKVQSKDGSRVTRDGRLVMTKDGLLMHAASGGAVLDVQGRPISVNPESAGKVKIDGTGVVRVGENVLGKIALTDFEDRQALEKVGHNLLSADKAREKPATGEIEQFQQEGSGVEPVMALTDMIAASRAYQLNATMITMQDESLGRVVNELGRIG